ncbi:MAG: hypothetical protein P1U56_14880 [Saprospiraceae bacterium]|nr:hypothetical protein [Saprospiraceae bacterium]
MKKYAYIILLWTVLFSSCSSPQKLYEKGKYFKAFDAVLGDIKAGKKNRKDVLLLNKSFSKMIDLARDRMIVLVDGYKINDLTDNFKQYEEVDTRFVKARSYINDDNKLKYEDFRSEKLQLIQDTYDEGKALMVYFNETNNKIDARNAYYHFELVDEYSNEYPDVYQLMQEAKDAATLLYVVNADLDFDFSYEWEVDNAFDDLRGQSGFMKIVYANSFNNGDCFVELDFSKLDVNERVSESTRTYTKQVEDGYTTETDTSGTVTQIPKYIDVSGSVTTRTITKTLTWRIHLEIRKSSVNCDLREQQFRATIEDQVDQYQISGDQRAIPNEYTSNINDRIRSTDDMVDDLIRDLYLKVRNYFY